MSIARLLVVDDMALQLGAMRAILEAAGYEVFCANSGADAVRLARTNVPDLILLDVLMPGVDGYAVCKRLKADAMTRRIPIIFVTVMDDPECEARCFALGAADFIVKPIHAAVMLARIRAQLALAAQSRSLREMVHDVIEFAPDALILSDAKGRIVRLNTCAAHITGYERAELIGQPIGRLLPEHPNRAHVIRHNNTGHEASNSRMGGGRPARMLRKDGSDCEVELSLSKIDATEGELLINAVHNIGASKKADSAKRIAATAFESPGGMVATDPKSESLDAHQVFTETTGYAESEPAGNAPSDFHSGQQNAEFYREMWATLANNGCWQGEIWDNRRNGQRYPKWLAISAVKGEDGAVIHYIGTHYDITARKHAEERIHALAFFDALTGLPNRTLLLDRLKQALTASERNGEFGALLFIDLDHFKNLNDTHGHDAGDALLQQAGHRLRANVRAGDTVARLGGDEFVVVLAGISADEAIAARDTELVAQKILACLREVYNLGGFTHHSTASLGATLFKGTRLSIEVLMKHADLTMYKAKTGGGNTVRFFDPELENAVKVRAAVEADLRQAVARRAFVLHYQPQVTTDGRITGVEALVRWQHPARGMVPPGDFIALAEETGLIVPLGFWVLESACNQLAQWTKDTYMTHLTMAVNVSAHQFRQTDFVEKVLQVLRATGARPEKLKLELTESLLVDNVDAVVETMSALKAIGIAFSLDDFGTGYSSLAYLKRLPLDQLKIDKSFVHDLLINANDAAIAGTIVALARSLGLSVIAEGVETAEQRDVLSARGCCAYQGYLFSRPLELLQFEDMVRESLGNVN